MTHRALARRVRSLYFRRRLARAIPNLEATIHAELTAIGAKSALLDGFLVQLEGEEILIQPTRTVHPGQIPLPELEEQE